MADLDMDATPPLDLSHAPLDVITMVLQTMSLHDRFTCALVCKAWAAAATAATRSIIIESALDLSCLQQWLETHGEQVQVLQLHHCSRVALTTLPCAQLQDLVLHGSSRYRSNITIGSRVWAGIASATKLTSVSLQHLQTAAQQADVVSVLATLPDLQQLTWLSVQCSGEEQPSSSLLIQQLTKLTALELQNASAAALEHLGSLTKLQSLKVGADEAWAAAGCPGLQELKALTSLQWMCCDDIPANACELTALQQLNMLQATAKVFSRLQALTGLTQLAVWQSQGLPLDTPPLQLPGLQHLVLCGCHATLPMSFLARCTRLRVLELRGVNLRGPGSLVTCPMLQQLLLHGCIIINTWGAGPFSWQQLLPGPRQLPHLTSLQLHRVQPDLQQSDIEHVVACCSSLQVLHLTEAGSTLPDSTMPHSFAPALAQLSGLTSLHLGTATVEECAALAQLTGLRELKMDYDVAAGLRQLAALEQLTSLGFYFSRSSKGRSVLQEHMSDKLPGCRCALVNKAPVGHPSDVPARLLRVCDLAAAAGDS